jgi:hypothetical protein
MSAAIQLFLFPATPSTTTQPATLKVKRGYCRHRQQHIVFLKKHYEFYSLKELAKMLRLTERQVFGLCRRNGIRKRTGWLKAKAHISTLAVAA